MSGWAGWMRSRPGIGASISAGDGSKTSSSPVPSHDKSFSQLSHNALPMPPAWSRRPNPGAVLALVKAAPRRLRRWPPASLDQRCAPRPNELWPGRRNGLLRPNKETDCRVSARSKMSTINPVEQVVCRSRHLSRFQGPPPPTPPHKGEGSAPAVLGQINLTSSCFRRRPAAQ